MTPLTMNDLTSDEGLFLAWYRRLPGPLKRLVEDTLASNDPRPLAEALTLLPPAFRQRLVEDMGRLAGATEAYRSGQPVAGPIAAWAADQATAGGAGPQLVARLLDRSAGRGVRQ